jgi:hypothetical protein
MTEKPETGTAAFLLTLEALSLCKLSPSYSVSGGVGKLSSRSLPSLYTLLLSL